MKLKSTIGEKNAVFGKDVDGEFKDIDMSKQAVKSEATIVMPEVKSNNENQANVKLRQLLRYEKRMDKGLLCALGLIIVLCLLGMGTSIGGALYLKFRSSHRNQTLVQALPITAPLKHHPHDFAETTTTLTTTTNAEEWVTEPEDGPATYKIRVNFTIPNFDDHFERFSTQVVDPFTAIIRKAIQRSRDFVRENGQIARLVPMTSNRITETIEELRLDSLRNQLTEGTDRMGKAINNDVPEDNDSNDKFTMVNTHRVLQKPPTLGEVLTAIRRALRIPTVKLVRDHDQI